MKADGARTVKTTCAYCGVGCGVLATPNPDGSVNIQGDPDHPANFGRLCSKGSALGETVSLEGRMLEPQINGKATDWDSALNLVADKFSESIQKHGPDSVAFYVSGQILTEDYYVANKLMKGFIGSANIDTNSRLCMASSVAGHRKAFGTDTVPGIYEDLELADLIVIVGANMVWCHPVLYQRIEAAKRARPEMKIVLVDPRRTMTAAIADMHLAIRPDGDTALFSGLLSYLANGNFLDKEYIEQHTTGFEEALASASLPMGELEALTGLQRSEIEAFYALFAATTKTVTAYSQGVNQSANGTDKVSTILNCHLATGRIGKPGMGPLSLTGQPNAMGGREVGGLANMLACHMDIENPAHRDVVKDFWKAPVIAEKQGLKAVDMFKAVDEGKIKAIWIMSTNPVDSMPDADGVAKALKKCPFVVVSDILEDTDTLTYAHVKLPAAAWGEKSGTVTNSERRVSRQRAFLQTPGNAKPDWWQLAQLAQRMGHDKAFRWENPSEIFAEYARLSEQNNDGARDFDIGAFSEISCAKYDKLEPFQWPQTKQGSQPQTRFFSNGGFFTPDRKGRFIEVKAAAASVTNEPYPFILNTGRIRDHWHTMTRTARTPRLSSHYAEPFCEINPTDAKALGVIDAGLVKVSSPTGEILVRALITDRIVEGQAFVPIHWTDQFASNARVDKLVHTIVDPFSGQPASKNVAVKIEPFQASAFAFLVSRTKPDLHVSNADYWAMAKCEGGWRVELAFETHEKAHRFAGCLFARHSDKLAFEDGPSQRYRIAAFKGFELALAYYSASEPVSLSREWLVEQLSVEHTQSAKRFSVLAGRADSGSPDKGAIVCSCMNVGANEIRNAITLGACTTDEIGKTTGAGTNCGSCRAEINGIIDDFLPQTKIAAE